MTATNSVRQIDPALLGDAIRAAANWLDEHNGASREELGLRVMKVAEEAGEAIQAWIGVTGQNPRKGFTHSHADVAAELADVAFAALVAIESLNGDAVEELYGVAGRLLCRMAYVGEVRS
ncbi:MAG: MazG-like family protein [Thermoanaerobaculia bacterium]